MTAPVRKANWGIKRCRACGAFTRVKCGDCEHCGCKPRAPKKKA